MNLLRKVTSAVRYSIEGMRVILCRTDLSTDETMDVINELRRKYGLRAWDR